MTLNIHNGRQLKFKHHQFCWFGPCFFLKTKNHSMMDEKIQIVLQHKKNEPDIEIVQIKMNISKTF